MRLIAKNISVDRGERRIVRAATFSLAPGDALVVRGPNGSGKSTFLRALAGFLPLAEGVLSYKDHAGAENSPENIASLLHYIGHADGLKSALTAGENLSFWRDFLWRGDGLGRGDGLAAEPAAFSIEAALTRMGVGHAQNLPLAYLSAGQRRRVALARLIVAPRPIWLLDEPTTALDAAAQAALADLMRAHRAGGGMVIAATHAPLGLDDARVLRLGGEFFTPETRGFPETSSEISP